MVNKLNIGFTGYYGMGNFGDDLFGVLSVEAANKYWNIKKTSIVGTPITGFKSNYELNKFNNIYTKSNKVGKILRALVMTKSFIKNDVIVLAGGSTIGSGTSNTMRNFQKKLSKKNLSELGAIGVSVGPFNNYTDYLKAKEFILKLKYISVRDQESFNILKKMDVPIEYNLGRDIAGLLPILFPIQKQYNSNDEKIVLGVSLCNYERYVGGDISKEEKRNEQVIEGIKSVCEELGDQLLLKVFIMNNNSEIGDQEISNDFIQSISHTNVQVEIISNEKGPLYIWQEVNNCTAFFSIRLHGGIAAYMANIPFCLVEYHEKCTNFLNDIGQPENNRIREVNPNIKSVVMNLIKTKSKPTLTCEEYSNEATKIFTLAPWAKKED
ncbi:hypothetical protein AS034_16265 [[Bacillus] enclensis]|uniref:Polysaccharide pyruvyl transferase family protein WcaK n=1 Tax=[Bacillus] enclensis TaxID=1402860 RepID=A0A0V8HCS8_9BACI|nr:polysaccharide pyruvyl transferase family protein [[Bacillus] enclensis]KSU60395.1 hypothetical protein AS034_16265 [[Bacillus] enclensis]SCC24026.1 Polysaccharide pyruvyl transferase family protein WcaK [[Bacillus] enclensis]